MHTNHTIKVFTISPESGNRPKQSITIGAQYFSDKLTDAQKQDIRKGAELIADTLG